MGVLDSMKNKVSEMFKDLTKMHDIDRDTLNDFVKTEIDGHKAFVKAISAMSKSDMDKFKERISTILPSSSISASASWQEYTKSLQTRAAQIESAKFFDSVVKSRAIMQDILEDISKKFSSLFTTEMISITDLRKSQVAVLGFISQSIILSNWSLYMWTFLSSLVDGSEVNIPKYRLNFIAKYNKEVVDIVNGLIPNDKISVADNVLKFRTRGEDAPLAVDGAINRGFVLTGPAAAGAAFVLKGVVTAISIYFGLKLVNMMFRWTQEKMELAAHEKYLKNKEMKEWLEAHVAKLRLELQSINPNDPQYQKMLKIIDTYDEEIRDLDEKINEYMEV